MHPLIKNLPLLIFVLFFYSSPSFYVRAQDNIPFTVSPVAPEIQKQGASGYFDFDVVAKQKQTIYVQIKNNKNEPLAFIVTPLNAITSQYGQILYDVNTKKSNFINLKVPLKKYMTPESEIVVPPNASRQVPLEINLPDVNEGLVLGGIHVIAEDATFDEKEINKGTSTLQIKNQIAYVLGIKMQFPEMVPPKFSFGKIKIDMVDGMPKLLIEMKNSAPAVIKDLSGKYVVTAEDGKKVLKGSFSSLKMAPNTRVKYPVDWVSGKLKPGTYKAKLTATFGDKKVIATKNFAIKETKTIKEYNQLTKEVVNEPAIPWWNYLLTTLVAGCIFFIIGRKSKKEKEKEN